VNDLPGGHFLLGRPEPGAVTIREALDPELLQIERLAKSFVQREILPVMDRLENQEQGLAQDLLRRAAALGLAGTEVPSAYGGLDLPKLASLLVAESLGPAGGFAVTFGAHQSIGALPLVYFGSEQQRQKYLPRLVSAEWVAAYALTEPESGSDAQAARAQATLQEDGSFLLSGTKMWISNAGFADLFTVFAQVPTAQGPRLSAFLVERSWPGVSTGPEEHKLGIRSSSTRRLILDAVPVPADHLLGQVGQGAKIAFNILNVGRYKLAAGALGATKVALSQAAGYALQRQQFGRPIGRFGLIQEKLAQIATRLFAVESALYRLVGAIDARIVAGVPPIAATEEYAVECSALKVLGSELLDFAVDENLQIHGGYGYSADLPVERAYRDSRINRIFEGTNEINRLLIPGLLLRRAERGTLPLLPALREAQAKLLEPPRPVQDPLGAAAQTIDSIKGLTLLLAGKALQRFGDQLEERQEVLARLADLCMAAYAADAALLRTERLGRPESAVAMTRIYAAEAAAQAGAVAGELAPVLAEGDEARLLQRAGQRLQPLLDLTALRRRVALEVLDRGGPLGFGS
jgi:alkylation response protein AidB-like acyl-CoA dehydrogenase